MKNFIARRILSAAIVIVIAGVCAGCAAGAVGIVTQVAPMVAAGSAQLIGSQVAMKEGSGTGASAEDNADKCDQLLRAPVGVFKDGSAVDLAKYDAKETKLQITSLDLYYGYDTNSKYAFGLSNVFYLLKIFFCM